MAGKASDQPEKEKGKPVEAAYSWENKTVAQCRQCGRSFMRYVYTKVVRCEECRKADRVAAVPASEKWESCGSVRNPRAVP
jgi:protein-arginine kinase activator protein McsA